MDNENLIKEMQELHNLLDSFKQNMVQYIQDGSLSSNLENVISSGFSEPQKGEDDIMASKLRERVKVGVDEANNPIYAWATGNTKEELHRSIALLLNATSNKEPSTHIIERHLWEDCAQTWFDVFHIPKVRPKTAVKDSSLFRNHVKNAFVGKYVDDITTTEIQNYLQTKAHYCKTQVRDIMWMIKCIFASACEDGYINRNPMESDRISNPSQKEIVERKPLTHDEQLDIIEHLSDIEEVNARLLMAFLMFTCMRPCEIYGLKWEDIDMKRRMIKIRRDLVFVNGMPDIGETKTPESVREIPIDPRLYEYLKPFKGKGYVIGKGGEHVTSESVTRKMWNRIKKIIDIHDMTPYVGRHTYATNMNRAGISLRTAMAMMGHKDERMLLRTYTHVDNKDLTDAGKTMTQYVAK